MLFADAPAITAPADANDPYELIEVVGTRPGQVQKIDRRTYRVKDNPHSAQADSFQLLRGLPAVTVTPDDQIMLLGSGSVRIFIDGRPYQGDASQYLRTLHGSDIERIEVITNPSAQYSAESTGGIINFVLRKKQTDGVSGTESAEISSSGLGDASATLKYKHRKWTYELRATSSFGRDSTSRYQERRTVEAAETGSPTINIEVGRQFAHRLFPSLSAKATYELDKKTSVSAQLMAGYSDQRRREDVDAIAVTPDFQSFSEHQRSRSVGSFVIGELSLDHKGSKEGESLKASAQVFGNPDYSLRRTADFSSGDFFLTETSYSPSLFAESKIDWDHPMGRSQIVSIGASWKLSDENRRYRFEGSGPDVSLGPAAVDRFNAISSTMAVYATFQQPIGSWTVMPGIRAERNSRRISSPGRAIVRISEAEIFPTLHVAHPLSKTVDLTLSYSKRIDRPGSEQLQPYRTVIDALSVREGNPHLRNQATDSYEINLHYRRKKLDVGVIIYDREKRRLWNQIYSTDLSGVTISNWVNAGHRRDSGVEIDLSMPIAKRVKAQTSVNLFDSRVPIDGLAAHASASTFRYTTDSTLEWDGEAHGKRPGDVAQLQWNHQSPSREFQVRNDAFDRLTFSYTHSLNRSLSLTGTADWFSAIRYRIQAPLFREDHSQHQWAGFRVKLLKTIGKN